MSGAISVMAGGAAAYGFLARAWRRAFGALILVGVLSAAGLLAAIDRRFDRAGELLLALWLAEAMARGALFRLTAGASQGDPGFAGFQWGGLEWRLLGAALLRWALFALLLALALTVLVALYVGLASAETAGPNAIAAPEHWRRTLDPLGWSLMGVAATGCATGLIWVWLRLCVTFAATAARGRVQVLSAWPLTQGRVWRLLGATMLIVAPLGAAILALLLGRAEIAADALAAGFGQALLTLPLSVGLMSFFYDRLAPEDAGAR